MAVQDTSNYQHTFNFFSFWEISQDNESEEWCRHSIRTEEKITAVALGIFAGGMAFIALGILAGLTVATGGGAAIGIGVCWLVGQGFKSRAISALLAFRADVIPKSEQQLYTFDDMFEKKSHS